MHDYDVAVDLADSYDTLVYLQAIPVAVAMKYY